MTNTIGYARVSTSDQNISLQLDALEREHVARVFKDEGVSGTMAIRPGLTECLQYLNEGDTLVVWKLDRLGRSTINTLNLLADLKARGVLFKSITERVDTTGPMGEAMFTIIMAFGQLERDVIVERTNAGLAAARAQGRIGGRRRVLDAKKVALAQSMYDAQTHTVKEIAQLLNCGQSTAYRYLAANLEGK